MPVIASTSSTVSVFQFKKFDIVTNEYIVARRYGTSAIIDLVHGTRIGLSIEIPIADVDDDGFTAIDYVPNNCL